MLLLDFSRFGGKSKVISSSRPKSSAFTLAEVLITLGIIGVVAAMTLPSLIQSYKKHEASTRLKKFYSTMSQAVSLAETANESKVWEWSDTANTSKASNALDSYAYWNKYFAPYVKTSKVVQGVYDEQQPENNTLTKVYFADGSTLTIYIGTCVDFDYDINGDKAPNETGRDIFKFMVATPKSHSNTNVGKELRSNISFGAGYRDVFSSREDAIHKCKYLAKYCPGLLQYFDNLEFKDDYPLKL